MRHINLEDDIKSLSEFRANSANFIKQIKDTKRPLILTQHGKSTAVLVDVAEYQATIEKLELLQWTHMEIHYTRVLEKHQIK